MRTQTHASVPPLSWLINSLLKTSICLFPSFFFLLLFLILWNSGPQETIILVARFKWTEFLWLELVLFVVDSGGKMLRN